jgi:hypothetical protein
MFCPQCGQQVNGDLKFCSRCGFPINGVIQLLESGGQLPGMAEGRSGLSPRQKGTREGVMMLLLTMLVVPLTAIITAQLHLFPQLLVPLTAVFLFVGGILRIIYAQMFEERFPQIPAAKAEQPFLPAYVPPRGINEPRAGEFFPAGGTPATNWQPRRRDTAELVGPPSVTENTTRLLDETPRSE